MLVASANILSLKPGETWMAMAPSKPCVSNAAKGRSCKEGSCDKDVRWYMIKDSFKTANIAHG